MAFKKFRKFETSQPEQASDFSLIPFNEVYTDAVDSLRISIAEPKECCAKQKTVPMLGLLEQKCRKFLESGSFSGKVAEFVRIL